MTILDIIMKTNQMKSFFQNINTLLQDFRDARHSHSTPQLEMQNRQCLGSTSGQRGSLSGTLLKSR